MNFKELITKYVSGYFQNDALQYVRKYKIEDTDVSNDITNFIEKFSQNKLIPKQEFKNFSLNINKLTKHEQAVLVDMLLRLTEKIHQRHAPAIDNDIAIIETCVRGSKPLPENKNNDKHYYDLLNAYRLINSKNLTNKVIASALYPGIGRYQTNLLNTNIPFALNTLRLVGKLSKNNIDGIDLDKPFYPVKLKTVTKKKAAFQTGIKDGDSYFPFKQVNKLHKGDTGDNTFLATNGQKILYVRGVPKYSPSAIFASKIATLISKEHFSSERLLDNRLVASREIKSYVISVIDDRIHSERKKYIEEEKRIFSGSGIIDEVTNFIHEQDPNVENYGFSTHNIADKSCHLSKIDFDRCNIYSPLRKEKYENNILTGHPYGIYHNPQHIPQNDVYINEKLYTRLKLSMIPDMLLSEMGDQSFLPEDNRHKTIAITEIIHRKKLALELFLEHPETITWLQNNPDAINQCFNEIGKYIDSHSQDKPQQIALKNTAQLILNTCQSGLSHVKLAELQLETLSVRDEINRLESSKNDAGNFLVEIGIIEASDAKIIAFNKLEDILRKNNVYGENSEEFYQELQDWKTDYLACLSRQRNHTHSFFSPDHIPEAIKKIEAIFAQLEVSEKMQFLSEL